MGGSPRLKKEVELQLSVEPRVEPQRCSDVLDTGYNNTHNIYCVPFEMLRCGLAATTVFGVVSALLTGIWLTYTNQDNPAKTCDFAEHAG